MGQLGRVVLWAEDFEVINQRACSFHLLTTPKASDNKNILAWGFVFGHHPRVGASLGFLLHCDIQQDLNKFGSEGTADGPCDLKLCSYSGHGCLIRVHHRRSLWRSRRSRPGRFWCNNGKGSR